MSDAPPLSEIAARALSGAGHRDIRADIDGAPAGLRLERASGTEAISQLYHFDVDLLWPSHALELDPLLGRGLTLSLDTSSGTRYLHGLVRRATLLGRADSVERDYRYRLEVVPALWYASRRTDQRIFQHLTVPQIVTQVLARYNFPLDWRLSGDYPPRTYCVQYGESDLDFVTRLLEHEGIYYWFDHADGQHTLVLADDLSAHQNAPGCERITYVGADRQVTPQREHVTDLHLAHEARSGAWESDDYDFRKPEAALDSQRRAPNGHSQDDHAVYEWPGDYTEPEAGEHYARLRLESLQAQREQVQLHANVRGLGPGAIFTLAHCPRASLNRDLLVVACTYQIQATPYASHSYDSDSPYTATLTVLPTQRPYRPARSTPRPRILGPQTAVVVGPAGREIWTDQYGRVKLHFHWDRLGQRDENSSCWVRVSSAWAGGGFGSIQIPRIGDEVVVSFLNGDPDHPLVTGRVYNAANMPPWALPQHDTQMGILSRSSPGGDPTRANAIRLEDKIGEEQVWIHAERNQDIEVENDETHWVGRDRTKTIDRDETNHIHRHRTETVDGNETITVHQNRTETVDQNETITIHQNRTETVDQNERITIHQNRTEKVDLNEKITIGVNRTESVGRNERVKIGVNQNLTVGSNKQESIGLTSLKNVGIAQMTNIGAAYNLNVGATLITHTGMFRLDNIGLNHEHRVGSEHIHEVGEKYSLTVNDKARIVVDGSSILLQVGQSLLLLREDGSITLNGNTIDVVGDQHIGLESERIDLN